MGAETVQTVTAKETGVKCSQSWEGDARGERPKRSATSPRTRHQQQASCSNRLSDSYPHRWLWLYSAESCSTTGSLAGLSIMSTTPSLRYGLPGKSPFTSECVPGGGMPVGSTVCGSASVTSSSIRLLDVAVPPAAAAAAADCLSTTHRDGLPPQFGLVPEQRHRLPQTRC